VIATALALLHPGTAVTHVFQISLPPGVAEIPIDVFVSMTDAEPSSSQLVARIDPMVVEVLARADRERSSGAS